MKLFRVMPGKFLHWPPEIDKKDKQWLGPGGVVDLEDPFNAQLVAGQEYKLEALTGDNDPKQPTPIDHIRYRNAREEFNAKGAKRAPREDKPAAEPDGAESIPRPDVRPTVGKEKRHGATSTGQVPPIDPR